MDRKEFSGRTVEEALTAATVALGVTSDKLSYEVMEKGSSGFLGLGSKEAVISVTVKSDEQTDNTNNNSKDEVSEDIKSKNADVDTSEKKNAVNEDEVKGIASDFLTSVFKAMSLEVETKMTYDDDSRSLSIDMSGPEMGIIIGKRGATLDSLQYLTNLAVNKKMDSYIRVKMDTEDYRHRRKATLENLAKNVAYKVKRTKRSVSLEAMNPYERRIIHYALQGDSYVTTYSEGEEPYRHVVVALK